MGSSRAALRAGTRPNNAPAAAENTNGIIAMLALGIPGETPRRISAIMARAGG